MTLVKGKVALISGAARGIGAATARLFAIEGAKMVIGDIRHEACAAVANEINAAAGAEVAYALPLDVRRAEDWAAAVWVAESKFEGLDILVNNAGITGPLAAGMEEMTEEEWGDVIDTNLKGPWLGMRAVAGAMRRKGQGAIVNISSAGGLVGSPAVPAYSASKGGLTILTKCAALTYATEKIRVNSVHPGVVETPMNAAVPSQFRGYMREVLNPSKRDGTAEEIAEVVLFLASDRSSFMTGSAVSVDGGYTAM